MSDGVQIASQPRDFGRPEREREFVPMVELLAATEPGARMIIVERGGAIVHESGGTPWWVPLAVRTRFERPI
jgi:hypothetical protein